MVVVRESGNTHSKSLINELLLVLQVYGVCLHTCLPKLLKEG